MIIFENVHDKDIAVLVNTTSLARTIFSIHVKRLGLTRVLAGALGMYITVPVFIIIHVFVIYLLINSIVAPLLKLTNLKPSNYIIIDRYKVQGLGLIDKVNCLFCGWVNGISTYMSQATESISGCRYEMPVKTKVVLSTLTLSYILPAILIQIAMHLNNNYLIASSLKLKKIYWLRLFGDTLADKKFAAAYSRLARIFLIYQKTTWASLALSLEQIESAWCPIKHLEKKECVVYPDHHRTFFSPHQIDELHIFLLKHGTVLNSQEYDT